MRTARTLLISSLAVLAAAGVAAGQAGQAGGEPERGVEPLPYSVRTWTTREGLPQVSPRALAQTADGSLWIGTFGGLARFDGTRFEVYDLTSHRGLRSNRITALLATADGALWVGTEDAGVARLVGGVFEAVDTSTSERISSVWALCEDEAGAVWVGSEQGLFRCDPGQVADPGAKPVFERERRAGGIVRDLCIGDGGALWVASTEGLLRRRDDEFETVSRESWSQVCRARGGGVWAAGGELLRIRGDEREVVASIPGGVPWVLHEDSTGVLWVGSGTATLILRDGKLSRTNPAAGPLEAALDEVISVLEDREGNLWFGGVRTGLSRVRSSPLSIVASSLVHHRAPRTVAVDGDGVLWVATNGLNRLRGGRLEPAEIEFAGELADVPRGSTHPAALAPRAAGGLWLTCGRGLARLERGRVELVVGRDQLGPGPLRAVLETSDGSVWIGGQDRLSRWRDGVVEHWESAHGAPRGVVQVLLEDSRGALWIGTGLGLARFDGEHFELWRAGEELPNGAVRTLYEDPAGDIWIGTYGAGLYRLRADGRLDVLGVGEGLLEATVSWILPDGRGHLLLLGNQALTRCATADLMAVADGERERLAVEVYDQGPGISAFEGNGGRQAAGVRAPDGKSWFCTVEGLARFDPDGVLALDAPPLVHLEWVRNGGERQSLVGASHAVELAPGDRDLELGFFAPSFLQPERMRFQYKLEGFDRDWVDAGARRMASYPRLPPGDYEFNVRAANAHGVWSEAPATLSLSVTPQLLERGWVRAVLVAIALTLLAGLIRLRTSRARNITESMEREVSRRTVELQAARRELEQQVEQRTLELSAALEEQRKDLEHRRELEAQLHQSEKLEAIGRLAGGLAHDFNNILTVVLGEAEIARQLIGPAAPGRLMGSLDAIHEAGTRAADLTRQLLAYSRRRSVETEVVDVGQALADLSGMLRRLVREDVRLDLQLPERALYVEVEPGHLEQVVVNLVVNACDAMPHGGEIEIEVVVLRLDATGQTLVAGEGREFARISVTDNGEGMDEETVGRVFEPFFTTKAPQRGTGLGLASVHGIVTQAGGEVRVTSKSGRGTTFDVLLPLVRAPLEPLDQPVQGESEPLFLCGTVLLCDDEEPVRSVVRSTLERTGLRVLEAASADEALELARTSAADVDLLVTDVIMPGGNGRELADAMRKLRPAVRVLYVSGYSAELLQDEGVLSGETDYISKPFRAEELLHRVAALLEAEGLDTHAEGAPLDRAAETEPRA